MKIMLPKFIRFVDTPTEGGGDAAVEGSPVELDAAADAAGDSGESDDASEVGWDQARALEKIRKVNAESKALRERAKAAEGKAAAADEAIARAEEAEKKLLRVTEAVNLGLPIALADRLRGDTPEEIAEDAAKLLELFSSSSSKPVPTDRPKPALQGGVTPGVEPEKDAATIVKEALGK